ncbi:MAG TPA: PAS domain S-box protein [Candidatus Kapabacteria bacterium]|nr:PAS domain S-box protein [Candidatus Kapabacteria bacterium]
MQKYMAFIEPPTEELLMTWAFEYSSNLLVLTDLDHKIQTVNQAFLDWFGFSREEVIGKHAGMALQSRSWGSELFEQISRNLELHGQWSGEVLNITKYGEERPCLLTITAIYSPDGEKKGYLATNIDLTEKKRLEEQIAKGERLASIAEGVATLLHELRTPLNGITMNTFLLSEAARNNSPWGEEELESIQLISKEAKRLEKLITSVLTQARNKVVHFEKVPIEKFIDELRELVGPLSEDSDIAIRIVLSSHGVVGYFDPDQMKLVFLKLLQNAIKSAEGSPERTVRISIAENDDPTWRSISTSGKVIQFTIDNSGQIMSSADSKKLFKPFFTSKAQGIGLGLAAASQIVHQHNGVIDHMSIHDGPYTTRFMVALPN